MSITRMAAVAGVVGASFLISTVAAARPKADVSSGGAASAGPGTIDQGGTDLGQSPFLGGGEQSGQQGTARNRVLDQRALQTISVVEQRRQQVGDYVAKNGGDERVRSLARDERAAARRGVKEVENLVSSMGQMGSSLRPTSAQKDATRNELEQIKQLQGGALDTAYLRGLIQDRTQLASRLAALEPMADQRPQLPFMRVVANTAKRNDTLRQRANELLGGATPERQNTSGGAQAPAPATSGTP